MHVTRTFRQELKAALIGVGLALVPVVSPSSRADEAPGLAGLERELQAIWKEQAEAERELELLKRFFPPSFDLVAEERGIRDRARRTGLAAVAVSSPAGSERLPAADGQASPIELHRLDVSGRAAAASVHNFLDSIVRAPRVYEIERLQLKAEPGARVSLSLRLVAPCFTATPVTDAARPALPLSGGRSADPRLARLEQQLVISRAGLLKARGLQKTLATLVDRSRTNPLVNALAAFAREAAFEALALREVRVAGELTFEGVVLGSQARAHLKPLLEASGFEVRDMRLSAAGECAAFSIVARLKAGERPDEVVVGNGLFDAATGTICNPPAPPAVGRVVARGASIDAADAFTLRLRDVDLVHAVRALHELTSESLIVDGDVKGRVDLDLDAVTSDEAFAALGAAGVAIGAGPLRRVTRAERPAPAQAAGTASYTLDPVNLSFTNGDVRDMLCLFGAITQRKAGFPGDLQGQVSIFTTQIPLDQALDAIAVTVGLRSGVDDERLWIGPRPAAGAVTSCGTATDDGPYVRTWSRPATALTALAPEDLKLAGLARTAGTWSAYVYGPGRTLWRLEAGQVLAGGHVTSVGPSGIRLQTDAQRDIELPFRP